uniref:Uncharacterized protein n=1 Tax=Tetranychus urticae TaxID=32264 RepID=T1KED5_TETUR
MHYLTLTKKLVWSSFKLNEGIKHKVNEKFPESMVSILTIFLVLVLITLRDATGREEAK